MAPEPTAAAPVGGVPFGPAARGRPLDWQAASGGLFGFGRGLLAAAVGWFAVAQTKGQPVAGGFVRLRMLVSVLTNGTWEIGVDVILALPVARRSAVRA